MLKTKHGVSFVVATVFVLLLVACGDDSSSKVTEPAEVTTGTMTDSRDGQTYKTVTIGSQTWMAENLNYETSNSYCYNDSASYCTKYGRLYTWAAAMDSVGNSKGCGSGKACSPTYPVRGVCPEGWHLPTKAEFETLFTAVGGQSTAGKMLKSATGWTAYGGITNEDAFAFSALPAGMRFSNLGYYYEDYNAFFWSSTEDYGGGVYLMHLYYDNDGAGLLSDDRKCYGYSVRCLKDDGSTTQSSSSEAKSSSSSVTPQSSSSPKVVEPAEVTTGTMTDSRDSQTYKTVTIGTQTWMAENLNYETANSYCYEDNVSNCTKYGRLYTWAAAMDSVGTWSTNGKGCGFGATCSPTYPVRGICPEGWHLPTKAEFETLITAVGGQLTAGTCGQLTAGKVLKSTSGWNSSGNGSDAFAFSALPAGNRDNHGDFNVEGGIAFFWSSTQFNSDYAYYMYLSYGDDDAYLDNIYKLYGFSVRCLKDAQAE